MLIYDTQYTEEEYRQNHVGWGHSPIEHAISVARRNKVKRLALFHHDIQRTDSQLDALSHQHCLNVGDGLEVFFAREGMEIGL